MGANLRFMDASPSSSSPAISLELRRELAPIPEVAPDPEVALNLELALTPPTAAIAAVEAATAAVGAATAAVGAAVGVWQHRCKNWRHRSTAAFPSFEKVRERASVESDR